MSHLVELFYSDHCLSCPEARRLLQRFVSDHPDVAGVERNIDEDPSYELATAYHLIATPAWVIDRHSVMYGVPRLDTLTERLAASTPVPGVALDERE